MGESRQIPLELALEPQFGAEDFLVSDCNADAYALLEAWPEWPSQMLLLNGPSASGKSHLAAIWSMRANARQISARALSLASLPALVSSGAVAIEDIDRSGLDEAALFHLLNLATEKKASVLVTSRSLNWSFETPDLLSRMRRFPVVGISAPDDDLIRALLVKMFVDRQLVVDTALVAFLATRMERSFKAVRDTVAVLDRETLARGKRLTRQLAAKILGFSQ
jgi:chromosomal replication initiation ATPase DnaA